MNKRTTWTGAARDPGVVTAILLNTLITVLSDIAVDAGAYMPATSLQRRRELVTGLAALSQQSLRASARPVVARGGDEQGTAAAWAVVLLEEPALCAALRASKVRTVLCDGHVSRAHVR